MNVLRTTSLFKKKFEAGDFGRSKPSLLITLCVLKNIGSYYHLPPEIVLRRKNKMVCWSVYRKVNVAALAIGSTLVSLTISKTTKQKDSVIIKDEKKQQVKLIIIRIHRP